MVDVGRRNNRLVSFAFSLLSAIVLGFGLASGALALEPRLPGAKMSLRQMQAIPQSATVVVKFREGSRVRWRNGWLTGLSASDAASFSSILVRSGVPRSAIRRLHARPEQELDQERAEAQQDSGRELADLNLYYVIRLPPGVNAAELAARFNTLHSVEFAKPGPRPMPPPVDIPPATPDLTDTQGYKNPAPQGIGALNPGVVPGGNGKGISFVDLEYSWQYNHEDLELPASANIDTEATAEDPFRDTDHGTAVLGILVGKRNGYGVTGIVPAANTYVVPANTEQFGYDPARALGIATGKLKRGEVIIIEQQYPACNSSRYGPLEEFEPVFDAVSTATAKGIIVVAAAGNGGLDLDDPACEGLFDRNVRDSRAILVGAGSARNHSRLSFSSYWTRVDLQGWGRHVTTTGYGDAFNPSNRRQRYTFDFGGTSSATPIVAGAVLAIQGALKAAGIALAKPNAMRKALVKTGTPQANPGNGKIGPLPRIKEALNMLKGGGLPSTDLVAAR